MHMAVTAAELYIFAANPAPGPGGDGLRPGLTVDQVTPGFLGFAMTAFLVVSVVLLMVSMTRRIRRVRYRTQFEQGTPSSSIPGDRASELAPINPAEAVSTAAPGAESPARV